MGQKISPTGFRLAVTKNFSSKWYANSKNFPIMLLEDIKVRTYLKKKLASASVSKIVIERPAKNAKITIFSSRPGVVIGKKGEDIETLRVNLSKMMGVPVHVNIEEVRKPETDAQLIADGITAQLEKRVMFRRAMKRAMQNAMRLGAQGIKITSAPPATPELSARCPASRPMTSTIMTRSWLAAVQVSRLSASITVLMAMSKPTARSVMPLTG